MSKMTKAELEQRRLEVMLQKEELELEQAQEDNQIRISTKAANSRKNAQRQAQLQTDLKNRVLISEQCSHRQGGSPANPYGGKGAIALKLVGMPDGFTELIMCAICRLRTFSPHPQNQATKAFKGETETAAKKRVEKYHMDKAKFDRLRELSKDTLTPESATKMECGTVIETLDSETGQRTYRPRPCDSYAVAL